MKNLLREIFTLMLLLSEVVGASLINLADAQPYIHGGVGPPKPDENPPSVSIFYPENNTSINTNNITLIFNVNMTAKGEYIAEVTYNANWLQNAKYIYRNYPYPHDHNTSKDFSLNLTEIPEGSHFIEINATELGGFLESNGGLPTAYWYFISGYSSIFFTIDTTAPSVSVLSMQDKTFYSYDVDLSFAVDEPTSQSAYSLDANDNVTIAGNTTLAGLSIGEHNLTIYAWDTAGNIGATETIYFTIKEPFPSTLVIASVITLTVVGIGLLVYTSRNAKKRGTKHE